MGLLKRLLAVPTEKADKPGDVDVSAQVAAVVTAWGDNLASMSLDNPGAMSVSVVADSDGDADAGDAVALYVVGDRYASWYILATGLKAEVIAFWSYIYDGWCESEMLCCSEELAKAVAKAAGYVESEEEARAAILDYLERADEQAKPVYKVAKAEAAQRYTLGVAYPANEVDSHGDWTDEVELERTAWEFMQSGNAVLKGAGTDHADGTDLAGTPVESYIWRGPDWQDEDGSVIAKSGDWMLGVVWNEDAWGRIEKDELTGYSIQGLAFVDESAETPEGD